MKKSTWFALSTVILIILILQAFGSRVKVYEKTKEYKTEEEVIVDYLENVNFMWGEKNSRGEIVKIIPNLDFYETISDRHRLLEEKEMKKNSQNIYIPYFKDYTIELVSDSDQKRSMLKREKDSYSGIENYKSPKSSEIYKVSGDGILADKYTINIDSNFENYEVGYREVYLVVVDEGRGYVVDNHIDQYWN